MHIDKHKPSFPYVRHYWNTPIPNYMRLFFYIRMKSSLDLLEQWFHAHLDHCLISPQFEGPAIEKRKKEKVKLKLLGPIFYQIFGTFLNDGYTVYMLNNGQSSSFPSQLSQLSFKKIMYEIC